MSEAGLRPVAGAFVARSGTRFAAVRRLASNPLSIVGLVIVVFAVVVGLFAPLIAPHAPFDLVGPRLARPSLAFPFGTDQLGRDVFSGVVHGTRISLLVGLVSITISVVLGVLVGAIAGFYGGLVDAVMMRITEIFQVMPRFFLALIVVAMFGASLWGTILVIGLLSWPEVARLVRGEFLTFRDRAFVVAARAYGAGDAEIIWREIMPNAAAAMIVAAALQIPGAILLEASLSFIGAGDPDVMSWGRMLNSAQQFMRQAWWTAALPGLALSILAMGLGLLADGVNDMLEPRGGGRS
jgi:peptide/nickel transport system permease protein